ncbi:MAG: hypothetical protein GY770_30685 [Aestuariibacter sp.]|nr:hypothetical protein [Aestuariibacter sp.]
MPKHEYSKDNQPDKKARKERGKGKKTLMLDAIRSHCKSGDEKEYLIAVVEASLGDPLADPPVLPNPALMAIVMNRIEPPLKSTSPMVEFEFSEKATPSQQASQVLKAASLGLIPPDIMATFVTGISSVMKIDEVTELQSRIEALEKVMNA